jgi:23S rRNA (cytidine1920-2'-O)/16S rRNA (cytidine1409-2'-O)-methyltransferase
MEKRADVLVFEKGLAKSRNSATALIKAGRIMANKEIVLKNAELVDETAVIEILGDDVPYVGRGGLKLEKALAEFKIDPTNIIAIDVGSSTGGFTECLLRQGAKKVYAIDVGTDQLDLMLKKDSRVISMEKTDIRNIKTLPDKIDLAVIDVSFISLEQILDGVKKLLKKKAKIIALVKPQFETSPKAKNKSGVVTDPEIRKLALEKIKKVALDIGLETVLEIDSPISGGNGNKEYLLLLQSNT